MIGYTLLALLLIIYIITYPIWWAIEIYNDWWWGRWMEKNPDWWDKLK